MTIRPQLKAGSSQSANHNEALRSESDGPVVGDDDTTDVWARCPWVPETQWVDLRDLFTERQCAHPGPSVLERVMARVWRHQKVQP
jgi:hypothetical protein